MAISTDRVKIGQYYLGDTLGTGSFGKVKVGFHFLTDHKVAIKILNRRMMKNREMTGKIRREIQNLKLFHHPHIVKLYQVISTATDIFLIMEYVGGGDLFNYILKKRRLEEDEARKLFQQIISAIAYCHRSMIAHRDLKPENVLLDRNCNAKICDFGLSNMMVDGEFLRTPCGSSHYASPEVISGRPYAGPEIDIWSCGVILYALLCGKLPFDDVNVPLLYKKIKSALYTIPEGLDPSVVLLLKRLLVVDPIQRATINEICEHPWFKDSLPAYLFPKTSDADASVVDTDAIREVCRKCGVTEEDVHGALLCGDSQHPLVIVYNLVVNSYLIEDELAAAKVAKLHSSRNKLKSEKEKKRSSKTISPMGRIPEIVVCEESPPSASSEPFELIPSTRRPLPKAKWHLGIRTSDNPHDVMNNIYHTLKDLDCEWKVVNNFNVHVRKKDPVTDKYVKLNLQLYRTTQSSYLLDFKSRDSQEHSSSDRVIRMTEEANGRSSFSSGGAEHADNISYSSEDEHPDENSNNINLPSMITMKVENNDRASDISVNNVKYSSTSTLKDESAEGEGERRGGGEDGAESGLGSRVISPELARLLRREQLDGSPHLIEFFDLCASIIGGLQ